MTYSEQPARTGNPPHRDMGLADDGLLEMYRLMVMARAISTREWVLQRGGKTAFVVTCEGHEAVQVASACAMRRGTDYFVPYYRDLAVALAVGVTPREMMLHALGRAADPASGGRNIPGHMSDTKRRILSRSSVVGTQIPQASGIALASKLRREDTVTICYFGDGATSQGDFHEGFNFAGIHRLPVVFVCENNGYAISVTAARQHAVENLSTRAVGYGFPGVTVDGNDVLAVYEATRKAADRARAGEGPTFIEAKTYRFTPHTSNDDPSRYRSKAEEEAWRLRDPIDRLKKYLFQSGMLDEEADKAVRNEVANAVDDATRFAEASPLPRPEDALKHVYLARE